ncbi:MAG: GAF domain-containing protein [Candidatus Rokubacteria bacterium]|nr:GAF domain-containing protein [Candidatus Rokubacteria bacterium]
MVIRRSVVYTALAGLITGAYALLIAGANALLAQADLVRSPWFSAAFMFIVVLVFNPLRERVRGAVDRTFFRERLDYVRTLQAIARSMRSLLDLEEITRRLTTALEASMHARDARLLVGSVDPALASLFVAVPGALSRYQVAADPRVAGVGTAARDAYAALGAEVVVPLRFQDQVRGLLVLGPKRSEAPYTAEDLALLETVADQVAVAVANAEAHRRVLDYARELERSLLIRTNLAKFVPQVGRDGRQVSRVGIHASL